MAIFFYKNKILFLALILVVTTSHAMEQCKGSKANKPFKIWAQQLIINQSLYENCLLQGRYILFKQMDDSVEKAKELMAQNITEHKDVITPLVEARLRKALAIGHPEARHLMRGITKDSQTDTPLQYYRLLKSFYEILELQEMQAHSQTTLTEKSPAYDLLKQIINHPLDQQKGLDPVDLSIRAQAACTLGFLCAEKLGIPPAEATFKEAHKYYGLANGFDPVTAKRWSDYLSAFPTNPYLQPPQFTLPISAAQPQAPTDPDCEIPAQEANQQQEEIPPALAPTQPDGETVLLHQRIAQQDDAEQTQQSNDRQLAEPKKEDSKSSRPIEIEVEEKVAHPAKKVIQEKNKEEQKPAEPLFEIEEDTSTQIDSSVDAQSSTASSTFKKPVIAKKKMVSKPRSRPSKEKGKKDPAQESHVKDQKKEKKHKLEKKEKKISKDSQLSKDQEKGECTKAYTLVAHLIDQYCINPTCSALIKSEFLEKSENWKTASATYKGAYNYLSKKDSIHPELLGILLYLQGNMHDARQLMAHGKKTDSITKWYKALIMLQADDETPDRNKEILALVDAVLSNSIVNYPIYNKYFAPDARFDEFIKNKADNDIAGGVNKIRALLYEILSDDTFMVSKEVEDELNFAHINGSIQATIHYAQMYAHGLYVKQSLSKALAILQESLTHDPNGNQERLKLLDEINNIAVENKDQIAQLACDYLLLCEKVKLKENQNIVQLLVQTEQRVSAAATSKKSEAAKLLISTGTFNYLLTYAETEKNKIITAYLRDIAYSRIHMFNHQKEQYQKIFELEKKLGIKQIDDVLGTATAIKAQPPASQYPAKNKSNTQKQIHIPSEHKLVSQWNNACSLFTMQPESEKRDELILDKLADGLNVPLTEYAAVKDLLIVDSQFIDWLKAKAKTNNRANMLLLKATILFDSFVTGVNRVMLMDFLQIMHANGIDEASLCLAQMYAYGIILPQSFPKALKIIQNMRQFHGQKQRVVRSSENSAEQVINLLKNIIQKATQEHDDISSIHATYFLVVQMVQLNINSTHDKFIAQLLQLVEKQIQQLDNDTKVKAVALFEESGACNALSPLSEKNDEIAEQIAIIESFACNQYNR